MALRVVVISMNCRRPGRLRGTMGSAVSSQSQALLSRAAHGGKVSHAPCLHFALRDDMMTCKYI